MYFKLVTQLWKLSIVLVEIVSVGKLALLQIIIVGCNLQVDVKLSILWSYWCTSLASCHLLSQGLHYLWKPMVPSMSLLVLNFQHGFNLCFDWLWPSLHSLGDVNRLLDHSTRAGWKPGTSSHVKYNIFADIPVQMHGISWWAWTCGAQFTCPFSCSAGQVEVAGKLWSSCRSTLWQLGIFYYFACVGQLDRTSFFLQSADSVLSPTQPSLPPASLWVFWYLRCGMETICHYSNGRVWPWSSADFRIKFTWSGQGRVLTRRAVLQHLLLIIQVWRNQNDLAG